MSTETHTDLPWHAEDDRVVFGSGLLVAECYGGSTKESEANAAFIVRAVNSHEALVAALVLLEKAEQFHISCDECNGEDVPELCEKCFPLYDDARNARRAALSSIGGGKS